LLLTNLGISYIFPTFNVTHPNKPNYNDNTYLCIKKGHPIAWLCL